MSTFEQFNNYLTIDTEISSSKMKAKIDQIKSMIVNEHALIALCQILKHPLIENFKLIRNQKFNTIGSYDIMLIDTFDENNIVIPKKMVYTTEVAQDKPIYLLPKLKKDFQTLQPKAQDQLIKFIEKQLAKCRGCVASDMFFCSPVYKNFYNYEFKGEITLNNYQFFVSHMLGSPKRSIMIEKDTIEQEIEISHTPVKNKMML